MGEESLCPVLSLSPVALSPALACERPGSCPQGPVTPPTVCPSVPFQMSPISHPLLINSWSQGCRTPTCTCPAAPRSASHSPVACQPVYVPVQEIKYLCITWSRLQTSLSECACECVCVRVCANALWWGKVVERGWAPVSSVPRALITRIT